MPGGNFLDQSFRFYWTEAEPVVPVTAQCDTLQVVWDRSGRFALTGPDHLRPHSFTIYTSIYNAPITIHAGDEDITDVGGNLTIALPPNTLYQICMYDKNGNSGGCQEVHTVIQPSGQASCSNWSVPTDTLKVSADAPRFGWVDQCDDLKVTMSDGDPPYIFSVQPALRAPLNVTGITDRSYTWKNILGYGTSFFITVSDAKGRMWSQGPMHSALGPTSCLDYQGSSSKSTSPNVAVVAGAAAGSFFAGGIIALAALYFFYRSRKGKAGSQKQERTAVEAGNPPERVLSNSSRAKLPPATSGLSAEYMITPFAPDAIDESTRNQQRPPPTPLSPTNPKAGYGSFAPSHSPHQSFTRPSPPPPIPPLAPQRPNVVELPPMYPSGESSSTNSVPQVIMNESQQQGRVLPPTSPRARKSPRTLDTY